MLWAEILTEYGSIRERKRDSVIGLESKKEKACEESREKQKNKPGSNTGQ